MKSLKPRLLTAVIGIAMLIGILYLSEIWNPIVGIVTGIASAFMTGEYLNANSLLKKPFVSIPSLLAALLLPVFINSSFIYLIIICYFIAVFAVMIANYAKITYNELAYSVTGTLLISLGMCALPKICCNSSCVSFFFVAVFAIPWMTDAGGYFVGASIGKHKLCPNISPKKTIEGAVGGVLFGIITSVLLGILFQFVFFKNLSINFFALILLGITVAVLSIIGDLSFSLIKRCYNIKDFGSIFPGHGGMLDRFDSIIFTAPVIVIINQFFPIAS